MPTMKATDAGRDCSSGGHISSIQRPVAKYSKLSNTVRQITPGPWQCAMFCGGKNCKYDNPAKWTETEMALDGLYSSWVGDNILAMARPSSEAIEKYNIVQQFHEQGIHSVINLQSPGEHSSCGNPLQPSGFSYEPKQFMDNQVFFYNFGWDDYGIRSLPSILDMVKVMSFALQQGKVAVHCHAGLGRTGVLIACYLIYAQRLEGDIAIQFVRKKRPGSIQTPGQIECCQQFAKFLIPFRVVFSSCDPCAYPFTLDQFLIRQTLMLHGYEARELKHLPKIVHVVCSRLAELAHCEVPFQPRRPHENVDILKKTAPGAFPSQRLDQSRKEELALKGSMKRAPLLKKRSSSAEDMTRKMINRNVAPPPNNRCHYSPMLDLRRYVADSGVASSSDDDRSVVAAEPRQDHPPPLRTATFVGSNRTLPQSKMAAVASVKRSMVSLAMLQLDGVRDVDDAQVVAAAMAFDAASSKGLDVEELSVFLKSVHLRVDSLQQNLNRSWSAWEIVATEEDPLVLSMLMWSWIEHLQKPILSKTDIEKLELNDENPRLLFRLLKRGANRTLDCILKMIAKLPLQPHHQKLELAILSRLIKALTSQADNQEPDSEPNHSGTSDISAIFRRYLQYLRSSFLDNTLSMYSRASSVSSFDTSKSLPPFDTSKSLPPPTTSLHGGGTVHERLGGKNGGAPTSEVPGTTLPTKQTKPDPQDIPANEHDPLGSPILGRRSNLQSNHEAVAESDVAVSQTGGARVQRGRLKPLGKISKTGNGEEKP